MKEAIREAVAPRAIAYCFGNQNLLNFICFWIFNRTSR